MFLFFPKLYIYIYICMCFGCLRFFPFSVIKLQTGRSSILCDCMRGNSYSVKIKKSFLLEIQFLYQDSTKLQSILNRCISKATQGTANCTFKNQCLSGIAVVKLLLYAVVVNCASVLT